jgi:hypothetical protein
VHWLLGRTAGGSTLTEEEFECETRYSKQLMLAGLAYVGYGYPWSTICRLL